MLKLLLFLVLLLSPFKLFSQLLINEFSSSTINGLADEDGDYNDWIELYNSTSSKISLAGFNLSDDASFLRKWTFPAVTIQPWSYLLIFASDKDRDDIPVNYETIITRGAEWEYLVPSSEPGNSWKYTGFNASDWKIGKSGFGYGDGDDSTVLNKIISVFARKEFSLTNIGDIGELVLSIDYDDGFIAYINGHEIARNNIGSGLNVPYNQVTGSTSHEAAMYKGGFPENYIIRNVKSFLVEGVNVLAVQGHNSGSGSDDFSLIPMLTIGRNITDLSDDVPDYIRLRGRKLHANFKLDAEGETLILTRPDSSLVDSVSPVRMTGNLSYGRKPDGKNSWFWFAVPSPSAPNVSKGFGTLSVDTIVFSQKGGYYPGGIELQLSSTHPSDSIFYTLDGSEPNVSSSLYTAPFSLSGSAVVRAKSIKSNRLPGEICTNTYVTKKHTLPVVCVSTDPDNLWDYNTGIYVLGPNASTVSPYFGANYWQDWEKKAHVELYDTDGKKQIDQDIGIKIYGNYSRARPQKSLALYARSVYGKGSFDYKVFKDKPIEKFEVLVLRNGGNDWGRAMMRDGLTSILIRDMDIERQAYQPAVVYLNGEYWGIQDLREKINSDFLAENNFVNPENVNLLVSNANVLEGSNAAYTQISAYLNSNTLESDQKYQEVKNKIDVNNYIQYQLTQVYIDNRDWPGNNIKFWNTNDPGSLWRWILYDADFGFGYKGTTAYNFNTLDFALVPDSPTSPNSPWATLLFRRMISNKGFRNEFANQYADRINRNFSPERVTFIIDSIRQVYLPEMADHLKRWNISNDTWVSNCATVQAFAVNRPSYARSHLRSELGLGELLQVKVEINQPGTGIVRVNSIIPYSFPFNGIYFKDLPIKLTAIPSPGYRFVKWEIGSLTVQSVSLDYNMAASANFRAVFESARHTDIKIVINEINYKSAPARDSEDWIELYNAGKSTVDLKGWVISDGGPESGYIFPSGHILTPGMYLVICRDLAAFRSFWPLVTNSTGDMDFGLSSSGDKVNLYDPEGNLVDFVNYDVYDPWPEDADATGESIELTDAFSDNNAGKNWKSNLPGGTPGTINQKSSQQDVAGPQLTGYQISSYPNPFSAYTTIRLEVAVSGRYRIDIHNIEGKLVNTVADQTIEAGVYYIDWYGNNHTGAPVSAGVYVVRLYGGGQNFNTRMIKLK